MTLQGYTIPRTPGGRASLVPAPPWHYVGDFLVVDFHADPEAASSVLPEGLEPHPTAVDMVAAAIRDGLASLDELLRR